MNLPFQRVLIAGAALIVFLTPAAAASAAGERRRAFNDGWRFFRGDAAGAAQPGFDDSRWQPVRLPHDWAIDGPFELQFDPRTGALPVSGTGWYRKAFSLPAAAKGRYFTIEFDGAMANSAVWLNGHELGGRPYGYSSFALDLTPYLLFGGAPNVLAVRLTPEEQASRWYPGAGIYRNVWLTETGAVHVAHWGVYVTTPRVTDAQATVAARVEVRNREASPARVSLRTTVLDPAGRSVGSGGQAIEVPAGGTRTATVELAVVRPQAWDVEHPYLYTLQAELRDSAGNAVDSSSTPFGIRTIAFDRRQGFLLNGRHLKLQGVCLHHDLGALGAAVNRRATERQLQIMQAAGVNAIRTSHNPPSPELLEFADRLGLLVMDEAFDMWRIPKVKNGYSKYFDEWSERDVRDMVRRDRNHPSVILWSIGNEIPEQNRADGWQVAKRLVDLFREEDRTRPTTAGFNNDGPAIRNRLAAQVDIPGFNYKPFRYGEILEQHPDWIIVGAETSSCVSSRGVYHLPIEKYEKHPSHQISSYDIIAPSWAYLPDAEFAAQDKYPQVLGEFVWTGFDYLGEPTPYFERHGKDPADWPARSSYFGMVDLAGFPKDRYYLYQSVWSKAPMVHVLPHWNWQGREGQPIPVMVYSNADEVELFLNGRSLGRKARFSEPVQLPVGPNISQDRKFASRYRLLWQVPYAAGALKAVAYRGGRQVAADEVRTASVPARVRLLPDRSAIAADGDDLSFVTVRVEDREGNLCPGADNLVTFRIAGAGTIQAVDNGNAATVEPFHAQQRHAFNGLALAIVRSRAGAAGSITLEAASPGLAGARVEITAKGGK